MGSVSNAARHLETGSEQNSVASTSNPATIFREGKEAMQSGKLSLAEEDFRRVIALDPKSSAAYVNLGVVYMREKRWDDALVELNKAESLSPDEPGVRLNIGLAYYPEERVCCSHRTVFPSASTRPRISAGKISSGTLLFLYEQVRRGRQHPRAALGERVGQSELPLRA